MFIAVCVAPLRCQGCFRATVISGSLLTRSVFGIPGARESFMFLLACSENIFPNPGRLFPCRALRPPPKNSSAFIERPFVSSAEFRSYFEYCRSLRFEDRPDYAYLKVRKRTFKVMHLGVYPIFQWGTGRRRAIMTITLLRASTADIAMVLKITEMEHCSGCVASTVGFFSHHVMLYQVQPI